MQNLKFYFYFTKRIMYINNNTNNENMFYKTR